MATEDDDKTLDTTQQDDTTTQQQDTTAPVDTRDDNTKRLDGMLDNFMKETDREGGTPPADKKPTADSTKKPVAEDNKDAAGAKGADARGQGNAQDRRVQQTPAIARQLGSLFRITQRGDVVDAKGEIVATSGYGRSIFSKLYPHIEHYAAENAAMKSRIENYESANAIAKKEGLSLDEHGAALQLMVQWKKDPKKTINTLLTLAADAGTDVSDIRQGGGGMDPAALRTTIEELLDTRLKRFDPFLDGLKQQTEEARIHDEVQVEYTQFIEQFPDAQLHEAPIARVMQDQGLSHREAYFAVKAFSFENGLDWTKDLAAQLQAKSGKRAPSGGGTNDRALPNMNVRSDAGDTVRANSRGAADPDESYDSIARRVFASAGRPVQ